jgi:predicted nucleotidyltransferase
MALLARQEIVAALERLGQLAHSQGHHIELVAVGGVVMVLLYNARQSTRDVDAAIISPREARLVRDYARKVADERGWPEDWLNDGAKGYLIGLSSGPVIYSAEGIEVRAPAVEQMLAMKLSAWRDDVDISDARRLLQEMGMAGERDAVWRRVEPYLAPGRELKAQYAFQDLWEGLHGDD